MQSNRDYVTENLNLKEQIIALKNANKILENLSKNQHTTIENLTQENEILKMNVKDTYETGQEIICELTQEKEQIKQWIVNKIKYLDNGVFLMSYERTKGAIEILNELLKEVFEL